MKEFEFLILAISQWPTLMVLSCTSAGVLWLAIRRVLTAGVFDPMTLALISGYSVNYAVVTLLFIEGHITLYLFGIIMLYGVILLMVFRWASTWQRPPSLFLFMTTLAGRNLGDAVFLSSLFLYGVLSLFIVASIGMGVFAETNRFDAARGYGSFIRILDCLSPFIVSYSTLKIIETRRWRIFKMVLLAIFVLYSSMVNGAKVSVIFSIVTIILTLKLSSSGLRVSLWQTICALAMGLAFLAFALIINLEKNGIEQNSSTPLSGSNFLVERLIYRIIAIGDTSYLTLPNNVIDRLETDSVAARFAAPLIGTGNITRLLGYEVADFAVGRQALLYHDPYVDYFGGPTSHFDLFAYVYFGGIGGIGFVALLGYILGRINRTAHLIRHQSQLSSNKFLIAWIATLWSRAVLLIVEPTVALAYILDAVLFFSVISIFLKSLTRGLSTRKITAHVVDF